MADLVDTRFGPICDAIDGATEPFHLLAGENIYLLTVLLLGSLAEAPEDVRPLFRDAAIQALLTHRGAGQVLQALCLRGELPHERTA